MLQCVCVSKEFGGLKAVKSVDFTVNENEITGLVGPNGSGKSTLLNMISGVYKPDSGVIRFLDEDKSGKLTVMEWAKMLNYINSFKQENALMALKLSADKDTAPEVVWKYHYGVPECPSPMYYDGRIYMLKNGGIMSCLVAKTGEMKKHKIKIGKKTIISFAEK